MVKLQNQQECIPVGCVPAARRPYSEVCCSGGGGLVWLGGCLVWGESGLGVSGLGGVWSGVGGCLVQGGCLLQGGVWSGGCLVQECLLRGVWSGRVSARYPPPGPDQVPPRTRPGTPPVNRITDRYKNITLAQLRCGR